MFLEQVPHRDRRHQNCRRRFARSAKGFEMIVKWRFTTEFESSIHLNSQPTNPSSIHTLQNEHRWILGRATRVVVVVVVVVTASNFGNH